jgi:serine protease inhibitor
MRMAQTKELRYFYTPELEAVRLPYGRGRMSMYIFLPREKVSMDSFLNALTSERWRQWMQQLRSREGRVVLPRFQLDYAVQLNEPLQALGMAPAFDPSTADFRPLTTGKPGLHVDEVRHKTFLEVNEEGSEAAAVTSVIVVFASAVQPPKPFTMIVDRPFFCAIKDDLTGVLLFVGVVLSP